MLRKAPTCHDLLVMPDEIALKNFYGGATQFLPPALTPGVGRSAALKAVRNDPSRTYREFPVQQLAFDFCDGLPGCRLRVWAFERDNKGRRRYVVASYDTFWRVYARAIRLDINLHYYEVIREQHASKLYFDLEFHWEFNPEARPEEMVGALIASCAGMCKSTLISRTDESIVELDSTTAKKFSRHLVFQTIVFHDNIQAGDFARRAVERLTERNPELVLVKNSDGRLVPFVDLGVYTKNRCFRLIGSSKFGKAQRLLRVDGLRRDRVSVSKDLFIRSLICSVGTAVPLQGAASPIGNMLKVTEQPQAPGHARISPPDGRRVGQSSPFPRVDQYVLSIIAKDGGGIYGVTLLSSSETIIYAIKGGYKYCANIGRHHKSNNVILIADLWKGEMYQKCFDPDCRGFRSQPWPLPASLCCGGRAEETEAYIDESLSDESLIALMDTVDGKDEMGDLDFGEGSYDGGVGDVELNAAMDAFLFSATQSRTDS